ncbi:hypothetical protein EJ06DRAFT_563392, partial [Trichodelitschia bisporula]
MAQHEYQPGDEVPFHFNSGIIVASYFVSLVGAVTTIELLHRRREGKRWVNVLQQFAISVSFGLVAIWCMHFVGNRAIVLGDGSHGLQLYYNPGYTVLSVFLPVIFLFVGFTTVELRQPGRALFLPSLVFAGVIAGLAITGMHYVGNFGITNYKLYNPVGYVVGAAAIAICASVTALMLFFYFKEKWINSLPRRVVCACLLAGAVSGMHWVASVGTKYRLVTAQHTHSEAARNSTLIVAIVISLLSCAVCLSFVLLTQRRKRLLADRAQHVVLAVATFDPDGRLLVTHEGLLPAQKVTDHFNTRSFADEFNPAHPVFHWLFRVSFNWAGVADLLPSMAAHLRRAARPTSPDEDRAKGGRGESYSLVFRAHFCVAASALAQQLQLPLPSLGVLYNDVLTTGRTTPPPPPKPPKGTRPSSPSSSDLESCPQGTAHDPPSTPDTDPTPFMGRGQLLFLTRPCSRAEASKLQSAGYRFATPAQVCDIIARATRVPAPTMAATLASLRGYCATYATPPAAPAPAPTLIAAFVLRAALRPVRGKEGWDVLVRAERPAELPSVQLRGGPLAQWQEREMARLDGMSLIALEAALGGRGSSPAADGFRTEILGAVRGMREMVGESWFSNAVFCGRPVRVRDVWGGTRDVYAFCVIPDVHGAGVHRAELVYKPLGIFMAFQRVGRGAGGHDVLARRIHREFGGV